MPFVHAQVSKELSQKQTQALLASLSSVVAEVLGKSENYVMASVSRVEMRMSASDGQAMFIDVRSIGGISPDVNRTLAARLCAAVEELLNIPKERIYMNLTDVDGENWGWAGRTFA